MARTPAFRRLIHLFLQAQQANVRAEGHPSSPPVVRSPWQRRKLLKLAALSGGAALTANLFSHTPIAFGNPAPSIAIIGGGIAGLNAAYQLKKLGLRATVYEARTRLGGRIQSVTGAIGRGLVSDLGGSFINTDHDDLLTLAQELNLTLFNRLKDPTIAGMPETGYYFNNTTRSEAEVAENLRPLARQISQDARLLDQDFETYALQFDAISVQTYLDRHQDKIPHSYIRTLIENTIRTEFGVEPSQSSALQLLFLLPTVRGSQVEVLSTSDEAFVVQGGSGLIIDRLAQALGATTPRTQIRLQMQLQQIQTQGQQYRLTFQNGQILNADYVILAIPFTILRNIDLQVSLPPNFRRMIQELNLGSNEKLLAGFSQRLWRQPSGFGVDLWSDLEFASVWEDTQRQPRTDGALSFYFGGNQVSAIQAGSTQSQGRRIVNLFNRIVPTVMNASTDQFLRTSWTTDPFVKGGYTNFKPGQISAFAAYVYIEANRADQRQDVRFGNLLFAGEHLSELFYGFMNGAAQTGRLAAESILRQLGKIA
ncbi:MAG: NAD(P)/FAD-dependent oxidoreductase [Synechococcales bacterium]|nr:NAD(P)/FAD-dependent oxidoreductase [Synechococcales bacterium]